VTTKRRRLAIRPRNIMIGGQGQDGPSNEPTLVANSPALPVGHRSRPSPDQISRRTRAGRTVLTMNEWATPNSPPVSEPQAGTPKVSVNPGRHTRKRTI